MAVDVLLGLQWGDEGKGKVVDVFTPRYDVVARFQGGPNAGHTIEFNGQKHVLHLIPSGIFHQGTTCLIGNGVVVDPVTLRKEIEDLIAGGIEVRTKLLLARRASIILPTHKLLDAASEKAKGDKKIGSTLKGIGPTYRDKVGRSGLRMGDYLGPDFREKYETLLARHLTWLDHYGIEFDRETWEGPFTEAMEYLAQLQVVDAEQYLHGALAAGKTVLAEGAQGTMLDIDFGSYPYVTSSNTVTAGACTGLGVSPRQIGRVYGIFKAYCTRVGSGPFPSELHDDQGALLQKAGHEFGATTGRPRRCGWLDLVALRYAIRINGVTDLIMTKADVLSALDQFAACTAYLINGAETQNLPYDLGQNIEPVLKWFPAWAEDLTGIRRKEDLPAHLMEYVHWLEAELELPITILSVGPDREQTLEMRSLLQV
ncbi:MAG: adenylosuccinate synthase [Bacteroidota bacterium]